MRGNSAPQDGLPATTLTMMCINSLITDASLLADSWGGMEIDLPRLINCSGVMAVANAGTASSKGELLTKDTITWLLTRNAGPLSFPADHGIHRWQFSCHLEISPFLRGRVGEDSNARAGHLMWELYPVSVRYEIQVVKLHHE